MRKHGIKHERVSQDLSHKLSELIQQTVKDPRVPPFTSVVKAELATDLKTCKVYISVLGDENQLKEAVAGLKSAESFLRTKLAKAMQLRNTPQLIFIPDDSIAYGIRMNKLLDEMAKKDADGKAEIND